MNEITEDRLRACGVPEKVARTVLGKSFQMSRPVITDAMAFAADDLRVIKVYAGPTQVGKTCAAAVCTAVARTRSRTETVLIPADTTEEGPHILRENGVTYARVPVSLGGAPVIGRWIHAPATFHQLFDQGFWTQCERAPLLIVDDLGLEPQDEKVNASIVGLLVARVDNGRKTVVTTNLTRAQFRATYASGAGERLAARLGDDQAWFQLDRGVEP